MKCINCNYQLGLSPYFSNKDDMCCPDCKSAYKLIFSWKKQLVVALVYLIVWFLFLKDLTAAIELNPLTVAAVAAGLLFPLSSKMTLSKE